MQGTSARRSWTFAARCRLGSLLLALCAGTCATACAGATAPQLDANVRDQVDAVAGEWLADTDAPSVSIAIVQQGALTYANAYGRATPASRYAIDSVTKEFTAAAVLLLAEDGKLSLDDSLAKWHGDLGAAGTVTLRQLLSHTSGIRDYWPQDFVTPEMTRPTDPEPIIAEWVKRPLDFAPGADWQYSNTNYVLAATVVQQASGERFFDFLQERIFLPLHMMHVTDHALPRTANDIEGYTRHGLGPVRRAPREGAGWLFGAADLIMRPADLAQWDISVIDRSLMQPRSYDAQIQATVLQSGATTTYGLGLDVEHSRGRLRIGHSGSGSGFLSVNRIWPQDRTAIVVFTNDDWASPADLVNRIAYLILPPTAAEARARTVFAGLQAGTIDRRLFTDIGNFYLDAAALADLHASLGPLGSPLDMEMDQQSNRGGMITRHWTIRCRHARLEAVERGHPGGQLDEFLILKRGE